MMNSDSPPLIEGDGYQLIERDCLEAMRCMAPESVDAIVTDPPYGLAFMGKRWDYDVPAIEVWSECLRILKPGGHLLAFAGTRTQHRMAVRIEDAGFEIRDMIAWVYGSGFPKSLDVSKAIDKQAGAEREVVGSRIKAGIGGSQTFAQDAWTQANRGPIELDITAPATDAARQWQGWGTALKPALEPITVARKPLAGTVAENVLQHDTGALNIDGCRIDADSERPLIASDRRQGNGVYQDGLQGSRNIGMTNLGRWPANLIHDGSDEVIALFPNEAGAAAPVYVRNTDKFRNSYGNFAGNVDEKGSTFHNDVGSAARFFYCAKASRSERDDQNVHPTVKPIDLMRYLCRLVTPPGGLVLDPFMGSGTTGIAARLEGFRFAGIEREPEYLRIAEARLKRATAQQTLFDLVA